MVDEAAAVGGEDEEGEDILLLFLFVLGVVFVAPFVSAGREVSVQEGRELVLLFWLCRLAERVVVSEEVVREKEKEKRARLPFSTPCFFFLSNSCFLSLCLSPSHPPRAGFASLYFSHRTLGRRATQRKRREAESASEAVREAPRMSPPPPLLPLLLDDDAPPPFAPRPSRPRDRTLATALERTGPSGRLAAARRRLR